MRVLKALAELSAFFSAVFPFFPNYLFQKQYIDISIK